MKFLTKKNSIRILFSFLTSFLLLTSHLSFSQKHLEIINKSKSKKFSDIVKEVEEYYKDKDKGKGSGYKQFKRWEYLYRFRLDSLGRVPNLSLLIHDELEKSKKKTSYKTLAATANNRWTFVGPQNISKDGISSHGFGRINSIAIDPADTNKIYVGTPAGGVWKTTNGGLNWNCISDNIPYLLGAASIVIDSKSPVNNRTVYIMTGDGDGHTVHSAGIFKSTDDGNTWVKTNFPYWVQIGPGTFSEAPSFKLIIHPTKNNILFAVTEVAILKSIDFGINWTTKIVDDFRDLEFNPANPQIMYSSTTGKIYRSADEGETWTLITAGLPEVTSTRIALAVTPANPSYVYAFFGGAKGINHFQGLYRSEDNGLTYNFRSDAPNICGNSSTGGGNISQSWYNHSFIASPVNSQEIYTGSIYSWRSFDGGLTWKYNSGSGGSSVHPDVHALEFSNNTLYIGTDGGIFKSIDKGNNWTDISTGLGITEIYKFGLDSTNVNRIYYGAQDNGCNILNGNTANLGLSGDGMEGFIDPKNPNTVYASTQYGDFYRSVGSSSWIYITPPNPGAKFWQTPLIKDPNINTTIYAGFPDIFKSLDQGDHWQNISNGKIDPNENTTDIVPTPSNTNIVYVNKYDKLYKTTDGGATWIMRYDHGSTMTDIEVHPHNPDILWATSVGGVTAKVRKSIDGGATWQDITGNLPNVAYLSVVYERGSLNGIYVGGDAGIYYKNDNLLQWVKLADGFPLCLVHELEIHYPSKKIRVATYGRGVWEASLYEANTNITPTVSITSPTNGQSFAAPASVAINATTTGTVTKVEFYQGDQKLGEDLTSPYSFIWSNIPGGVYTISAKAINSTDTIATTDLATINVTGGVTCASTGSITRDFWANILGAEVYKIPVTTSPTSTSSLSIFEGPRGIADHYGSRIRGYVCPPLTGSYTFWIAADDQCELWLSTDENPANKKKIAYHTGWNFFREWEKYPTQKSVAITLTAGKRYYIEALQKEHELDDHVSVGWQIPGGIQERPIPGNRVSPFVITNNPPTVILTSPGNNSTFTAPATFTITANASDTDGSITKVEFYQGSTLLGTDASSPYNFSWTNVPTGTYYITAIAYDNSNNKTVSAYISVVVNPGSGMPTASITSPTNNTAFNAPATITINANASDPGGAVTKVEFYQGSTLIATDVSSPYSVVWSNVVVGTYYLTAVAYDNSNNHTVSQYITITVGVINKAPTVSLTSPLNNSSFSAPANITMNANASDSDGNIAKVEFYQGTTKLGEDATSPYSFSWSNVAVGNYTLTAKAFDNLGASTISSAVNISVSGGTSCTASGTILREFWNGVSGTAVSTVPVNLPPTSTSQVSLFEGPSNVGSNYAARYRGYICVPVTGNYIFWISSNDASELWLSTNDAPANKVKIAFITGYTGIRQWDKYTTQKSATINLVAGQRYYIEALHKQGTGTDNLAVGWQLPNGTQERPIPGTRLSPYTGTISLAKAETIKLSIAGDTSALPIDITMYPNPIQKGNITLAIEGYEQTKHKVYISIVNQSGSVVYSDKVSCDITCRRTIINIDDKFQSGLYIVNVTIDKKVYSERLLVE